MKKREHDQPNIVGATKFQTGATKKDFNFDISFLVCEYSFSLLLELFSFQVTAMAQTNI